MLKPGHRIGSYEIRDVLGDGGMAVVYRATHTAMGTEHAIKVLLPNLAMNPKTVERFRQEARAQFRLRHPNIVQVTDYVETGEEIALVMDLVQGMTLRAAMDQRPGPWSAADVVEVMRPVIEAVSFAHREGLDGSAVVHRDLKPENILLDLGRGQMWPGIPKVADFGIAKVIGSSNMATRTNSRMGSVPYMAPEQFRNAKDVDPRADVWALGMMLWHLLAGYLPVDADDNLQLLKLYEGMTPVPPLTQVVPSVPRALSEAVEQALSVDVGGRFQDAWPLLRAVESGVAAHPVQQATVVAVRPVEAALAPVRPPAVMAVDDSKASAVATTAPLTEGASVGAGVIWFMVLMVIFAIVTIWVAVANWKSEPDAATGAKTVTPAAAAATPQVAENPAKPASPEIDYAPKTREEVDAMPKFDGDADRFKATSDGTVKDNKFGLVWQLADSAKDLNWAAAKDYCGALALAGTDWRLPTVAELRSLIDSRREEGKKIAVVFDNSDPWFWSSTADHPDESNAWSVSFGIAASVSIGITGFNRVRCVRSMPQQALLGTAPHVESATQPPTSAPSPPAQAPAPPPPDSPYRVDELAGTVLDTRTQLTWQRNLPKAEHTWSMAKTVCKRLKLGGIGWRLPSQAELESLLDAAHNPRIDPGAFPQNLSDRTSFWSDTASGPAKATIVKFRSGSSNSDIDDVSYAYRVRCVHSDSTVNFDQTPERPPAAAKRKAAAQLPGGRHGLEL